MALEHGRGRLGPFPDRWGIPRGDPDRSERVEWVRASILRHEIAGTHSAPLQLLLQKRSRLMNLVRLADLGARRPGVEP